MGLRICKLKTRLGNAWGVLKKKEKLRVLIAKSTFLTRINVAFLASGVI